MYLHFSFAVFIALILWYLHEYQTSQFITFTRNIPYLAPIMAKLHSSFSRGSQDKNRSDEPRIFTAVELSQYNGEDNSQGIYISILGRVFDVQKGKKHYMPGGTYHIFAGRDASRAFVTGEFSPDKASDHVLDLEPSDMISLQQWLEFYEKDYDYKGKLIGRYYTQSGHKTEYHKQLDETIKEARIKRNNSEEDKKKFPPCNVEWSADEGSRFWCSNKSGGIIRDWIGVPRKLYEVGTTKHHCVCINLQELHNPQSPQYSKRNNLEEYEGCDPNGTSCFFNN